MKPERIIKSVRYWVETVVVDLNLCPFARRELVRNKIRFAVTEAATEAGLLTDLQAELQAMHTSTAIETTLLIHPNVLTDFYTYNQFLDEADNLLTEMDLDGIFQIASFHPAYQFAGTQPDDVENYTNRSPYPMLHLLREESVAHAIASHPDAYEIPAANIRRLKRLGEHSIQALLQACFDEAES